MTWNPRVLGIDPSLTATGIALIHGDVVRVQTVKTGTMRGHERMNFILGAMSNFISAQQIDLAVVEGPSYGSQAGQRGHHERGGLWWQITRALWVRRIPYAVMSPNGRALYAAGDGHATKKTVVECVRVRYPGAGVRDDNQADALALAAAGVDHLGGDVPAGVGRYREALKAVEWPPLPADR